MPNPDWTTMETLPLLDRAIAFAVLKHSGQCRKGANLPYITHVVETMEIISRMSEDEELRAAAVLHDTLEDTDTTKEELAAFFGPRVADLVAAESEDKRENQPAEKTWLIRKQETIHHLARGTTEIRMLALADKLSNVRAMYRDYQVIGDKLWEKFNKSDPKVQGWYYCSLVNIFREDETIRSEPAFKEYAELCAEIFHMERDQDGKMIVPVI